mmetsp:Transcript_6947/g.14473  ORF Transcript_6947/g.14473 Transcript_6947/m.14473 type:complete len:225 (+) Transcript_6947:238-912(+)
MSILHFLSKLPSSFSFSAPDLPSALPSIATTSPSFLDSSTTPPACPSSPAALSCSITFAIFALAPFLHECPVLHCPLRASSDIPNKLCCSKSRVSTMRSGVMPKVFLSMSHFCFRSFTSCRIKFSCSYELSVTSLWAHTFRAFSFSPSLIVEVSISLMPALVMARARMALVPNPPSHRNVAKCSFLMSFGFFPRNTRHSVGEFSPHPTVCFSSAVPSLAALLSP